MTGWMGLVMELSHHKMNGVICGLIAKEDVHLFYSKHSWHSNRDYEFKDGEKISYNIHNADFFPKIDAWLKDMRKTHPVRKSKKRIS